MEPIWTEDEKARLVRLCAANKKLKKLLEEFPDKSESQIRTKCRNMGLEFNKSRKKWTDEELKSFEEDWTNYSISNSRLRAKYRNRTLTALRACARRLGLAKRPYDDSYLKIADVMAEMQVPKDRVRMWLKNGLKHHKSHIKSVKYLIDPDDLLEFLKEHPTYYDASKISIYIFHPEPEWLTEKRRVDAATFKTKSKRAEYYDDAECRKLEQMFKAGMSNAEIGEALGRTEYGIERMLAILNLSRKRYNQYEIDIIRKFHETKTIDEIVTMLPLRTRSGVIAKCEQLHIKYKTAAKPRAKKAAGAAPEKQEKKEGDETERSEKHI